MTTEKQTPEALAAECKRLVIEFGKATVRVSVNISKENIEGITVAQNELHAAIDRLAALASAQAQQEPPVAHGVFVGTRLVKLEESAQLAGEWAQREIVRGSPLTYHIRSLYTAPPVQQASEQCGKGCACLAQCGDVYAHAAEGDAPQPGRAGVVPNGWKLVPVALTEEMIRAGGFTPSGSLRGAWADMLNAAPPAPAVGKRESLTLHQISDAAREAQIAFCLDKYTSFEVALARAIERAHGITPADAKEGE